VDLGTGHFETCIQEWDHGHSAVHA
jgi:hypothetical protein